MTPTTSRLQASATWDARHELVGREFVGAWTTINEAQIDAFESATMMDSHPHAVNPDLYPDGLVEGFHLLSLLDFLVNGVSFIDDARWSGWNYGLDRVRFVSSVTTQDAVRVRGTVASITPRASGELVLYHCQIEVEGRTKPAMTAEWRVLWTVIDD